MNAEADSSERDPVLESAWRAHSREAPPPELDRAILAAAHRAVGSGPQDALQSAAEATRPQRWWMPIAAAATIGVIAIGILQLTPQEPSGLVSDERVAEVARRGGAEQVPAPAAGKTVDEVTQKREAAATGAPSDAPVFRQKKEQEARRAALPRAPAPSSAPHVASSAPLVAPIERPHELDAGKPAAGAPEPQPFPAVTEAGKTATADIKHDDLRDGAANNVGKLLARPPEAPTRTTPAATAEEQATLRKDIARERKQVGAADKTAASAQSGHPSATGGAASSFAPAPASRAASSGDGDLARNEASVQAAPAASPPPVLAGKVASAEQLRAQARDPDAWIARIRKLRDEGDTAEALRELREFRNLVAGADQRLPADLLAWANTFKP